MLECNSTNRPIWRICIMLFIVVHIIRQCMELQVITVHVWLLNFSLITAYNYLLLNRKNRGFWGFFKGFFTFLPAVLNNVKQ